MNVLMVGSGEIELGPLVAGTSYRVWRYERESDRDALAANRFDLAVLVAFSDALPRPVDLLREVAALLAESGRIVLDISRVARAAVRAAVYKGSVGETVAPVPSDEDVAIHGRPSLIALLDAAGFQARDTGLSSETIEATVVAAHFVAIEEISERARPEPSTEDRLAFASEELRQLRAFFAEMMEGQRTLQRDVARLHRLVDDRDREIADLRSEAARSRERLTTTAQERHEASEARERAARALANVADLERRLARAIGRGRDEADDQTSTE